jgi:inorganic pyrophosphatase
LILIIVYRGGEDEKVICVPLDRIDPYYTETNFIEELPSILRSKIEYFFQHYKDLQPNSWSKVIGWGDRAAADKCILESIDRYWQHKREESQ